MGNMLRCIHELSTEEAYWVAVERLGHELPPLDAVLNEDWGRDLVLQTLEQHSEDELAAIGLTWERTEEED